MKPLRPAIDILSADELNAIQSASLRILEHTGVRVPHEECLALAKRAGAIVDESDNRVRIPAGLISEVLRGFRKSPTGEPSPRLEGVISTQLHLVDYTTGTRRPGTLDDVRKGIALVEGLRNFPTANAVVIPADADSELTDVYSLREIYRYSHKPGCTYVLTPYSAKFAVEMAEIVGRDVWFLLDPISPLQFRRENLEMALIFARAKQPLYVASMVMAGATGPVTLAGTVALHHAELLASLFLVFALTGGYRYRIYNSGPHSVDPRTMICSFGSPNQALLGMCMAQLGRHYGLDCVANAGLTDSLRPDFQAGFEKASTAVFSALAGIEAIGCQGLVGADQGFSFEQLVLDNEWMEYCNYILGGLEANAETIAVELIESLGIGGSYIAEEHTARQLRKNTFQSKLLNRQGWDGWLAAGAKDSLARAHDVVETATSGYRSMEPVCTADQFAALDRAVETARVGLARV